MHFWSWPKEIHSTCSHASDNSDCQVLLITSFWAWSRCRTIMGATGMNGGGWSYLIKLHTQRRTWQQHDLSSKKHDFGVFKPARLMLGQLVFFLPAAERLSWGLISMLWRRRSLRNQWVGRLRQLCSQSQIIAVMATVLNSVSYGGFCK